MDCYEHYLRGFLHRNISEERIQLLSGLRGNTH